MKQFKDFPFKLFIPIWLLMTIVFYINFNTIKAALFGDISKYSIMGLMGILSTILLLFAVFYFSKLNISQYLLAGLLILITRWIILLLLFVINPKMLLAQLLATSVIFIIEYIAAYYILKRFVGSLDYTFKKALIFTGAASVAVFTAQTIVAAIFRNIPGIISFVDMAAFLGGVWLVCSIMFNTGVKFVPNKSVAVHVIGNSPTPAYFSNGTNTAAAAPVNPATPKLIQAGTQYRDQSHAETAWIASHVSRYTPVVICQFDDLYTARNVLESLSFIKSTDVPGQYISTEIIEYGCYVNAEDKGEVIICGNQFTQAMYEEVKKKFSAAGGIIYRDQAPKGPEKPAAQPVASNAGTCKFIRTERTGMNTYEVYRGGSKADALAFLQSKTVTQRLYYIIVETPQGNFGKDVDGIFEE